MPTTRKLLVAALATALILPAGASAQQAGELTFYSEIGFRGQSYTVTGERAYARVPFRIRSAEVGDGEAWEICPLPLYQGNCNVVTESQANIAWTVNSARPSRAVTLPAPVAPVAPANGQSLRGMSSEFFPQPSDGRGRVASCNSGAAACTAESADRFCESRGWAASAYQRQQSVSGRNYLADVLCTRTR